MRLHKSNLQNQSPQLMRPMWRLHYLNVSIVRSRAGLSLLATPNLNQFPFGLDLPFTHLLWVILNSRYFKLFLFPLTVQNNGVQLYDYDYKNNKKFVPGEGIPLPTKEILIMKTIFYSILAEPQKISNFLNTGDTT